MGGPSAPGWAGRTRVLQLFTEHCDVLSAGPQSAGLQAWGEMPTCKALWDQGYYMQMAHYNVLPYRRTQDTPALGHTGRGPALPSDSLGFNPGSVTFG